MCPSANINQNRSSDLDLLSLQKHMMATASTHRRRLVAATVSLLAPRTISSMATTLPPKSPYGTFEGTLFQYAKPNLVAFESNPSCPNKCILIGGLSDGLIPTPYAKDLELKLVTEGSWSLVQPLLCSSYLGFGNGDLNRDTCELDQLLLYLKTHHGAQAVALVGHSTGCQNSIHYLKHGEGANVDLVKVVALQAPVSDREDAQTRAASYASNIATAKALQEQGKEQEMMPRSSFWAPITAKRFLDLQDIKGADDFFSSDLTDDELVERLSHVGTCKELKSILVAFSGSDEYVASHVDGELLTERLCAAMNHHRQGVAVPLYLKTGNHNLSEAPGDWMTFVDKVVELLKEAS